MSQKIKLLCISLISIAISGLSHDVPHSAQAQPIAVPSATDQDFNRLLQTLNQYGFQVVLERPPISKAYGLIEPKTKTIWIHPITIDLGISKQTLIHEAVHAAQSCYNQSPLLPIGLEVPIAKATRKQYWRYHNFRRHVEAEALTVQGLPNGVDYAQELLAKHCS